MMRKNQFKNTQKMRVSNWCRDPDFYDKMPLMEVYPDEIKMPSFHLSELMTKWKWPLPLDQGSLPCTTANTVAFALYINSFFGDSDACPKPPSRLAIHYAPHIQHTEERSFRDIFNGLNQHGACLEQAWTYTQTHFMQVPDAPMFRLSLVFHALHRNVFALKAALTHGLPVLFGFTIPPGFHAGGILPPATPLTSAHEAHHSAPSPDGVSPTSDSSENSLDLTGGFGGQIAPLQGGCGGAPHVELVLPVMAQGQSAAIVGWDDNCDAGAKDGAAGDGAKGCFIVRNSFGPMWGCLGEFHVRYECLRYMLDVCVVRNVQSFIPSADPSHCSVQ